MPNADNLIVEREKIVGYLLDITHPRGVSKAHSSKNLDFDWSIGHFWPKRCASTGANGVSRERPKPASGRVTKWKEKYKRLMAGGHGYHPFGSLIAGKLHRA